MTLTTTIVLSTAQNALLRRLARRADRCRSHDALPARSLVTKGLARIDPSAPGGPLYEITPAGRQFIARGGRQGD